MQSILTSDRASRKATLAISSLVHSYCRVHEDCGEHQEVRDIISVFEDNLRYNCKTTTDDLHDKVKLHKIHLYVVVAGRQGHLVRVLTTSPPPRRDLARARDTVTWSGYSPPSPGYGYLAGLPTETPSPLHRQDQDNEDNTYPIPSSPMDRQTPVKTLPSLVLYTWSVIIWTITKRLLSVRENV